MTNVNRIKRQALPALWHTICVLSAFWCIIRDSIENTNHFKCKLSVLTWLLFVFFASRERQKFRETLFCHIELEKNFRSLTYRTNYLPVAALIHRALHFRHIAFADALMMTSKSQGFALKRELYRTLALFESYVQLQILWNYQTFELFTDYEIFELWDYEIFELWLHTVSIA